MANPYGGPGDQNIHHRHAIPGVTNGYGGLQSSYSLSYPPTLDASNPSLFKSQTNLISDKNGDVTSRADSSRTPSPTPSESALLNRKGVIDWQKIRSWKFWVRREWLWYYVILGIILIIVILISVYDRQIVRWLQPTGEKIRDLPAGWVIPIAIFFVISFPPLFGHEILAILCGVVWGLWLGFAITAAGTFVGELGNFFAFKYCCRARGEKLEKTDLQYACLARTVREGGFRIALVARYSAIPGHFTTAVFSTCGMSVLVFALAAFLSLPKQFVTVYIGVILEASGTGTETTQDKIISYSVLTITGIITCVAMWYLYKKMDVVKVDVIYERRKTRQEKLDRAQSLRGSSVFNPDASETDLPLNPGEDAPYQQWNEHGRATGYTGDPRHSQTLHVPTPHRVGGANVGRMQSYRVDDSGGYAVDIERAESYAPLSASTHLSSSQNVSPTHIPAPYRHESTDSAGWDAAGQVGGEAYRLPTIRAVTPLSGGFVNTNVPQTANSPFNQSVLQQVQESRSPTDPVLPPLTPPSLNGRSNNPYSPPSSPSHPVTSAPGRYASPQIASPTVTSAAVVTASPVGQHFATNMYHDTRSPPISPVPTGYSSPRHASPAVVASPVTQQYPVNTYPNPRSPSFTPPMQTPTRQTFASQPYPPIPDISSRPQSPASPRLPLAFPHEKSVGPPNAAPLSSDLVGIGSHVQESSGSTAYFTPAHSRTPTENQPAGRLPTPNLPKSPPPEYRP